MKASIILPAYNEEKHIGGVIEKIPDKYEIIVVDDGSTDRTMEVAKKYGCTCVRLNRNMGKGFACRTGTKIASNKNIVFMDSDGQLDAGEIPKMLSALRKCDLAVGTRNMNGIPVQRRVSNNFAKLLMSRAAGRKMGDVLCGFRAIRRSDFSSLGLVKKRYEIEAEMIIKAVKNGLQIREVPISVRYGIGSSMPVKDSFSVTSYILSSILHK